MRTVALYGNSLALSSIAATLAGRPGLRVLPAEQLGALQPDAIIFDLAAPRSDFNIGLWRARPEVLLIGVDLGSDRMFVLSGRPSRMLTLENLYHAIESLPQGEVMAIKNRKYVWLGASGVAAAAVILTASFFWPPISRNFVQGAIGHRDVYKQQQLTDKDVGVAGQVKVTVDDIRNLLESPEFKTAAKDPQFQKALADGKAQEFIDAAAHVNDAHNAIDAHVNDARGPNAHINDAHTIDAHVNEAHNANAHQSVFSHTNEATLNAIQHLVTNAHSAAVLSHVVNSHEVQGLANNGHLVDATFSGAVQKSIVNAVASAHTIGAHQATNPQ